MEGVIRRGHTAEPDTRKAVAGFHAEVFQPECALVIFFCSDHYDLPVLAQEIERHFAGTPVIGCTTAAEIGPLGYREKSLSGLSLPASEFSAVIAHLDDLQHFSADKGQALARAMLDTLQRQTSAAHSRNLFAFQLIDGLSGREEVVTHSLQQVMGNIPVAGGSAADSLRFQQAQVYHNGRFHKDSAVWSLLATSRPFTVVKSQHYSACAQGLLVTAADPENRIVKELNGHPAAEEYARAIGIPVSALGQASFAAHPVVIQIGGRSFMRSIQQVDEQGGLQFHCAIAEGLVLRMAQAGNLLNLLEQAFEQVHASIGQPDLFLGCDCMYRYLEIGRKGLTRDVARIFSDNNTIGFCSYGEQLHGVHINQTLTGIAFGKTSAGTGYLKTSDASSASGLPSLQIDLLHAAAPATLAAAQDENHRLKKMLHALLQRSEQESGESGSDFGMFQTNAMLEELVRHRTDELQAALVENEHITQSLRESEEKFRGLVDQSLVGIDIIQDGRFTYANNCVAAMFGYSVDELLNKNPMDLVAPHDWHRLAEHIKRGLSGLQRPLLVEFDCIRKDGKLIHVQLSGTKMMIAGKPALIDVVTDITEQKQAEQELSRLHAKLKAQAIRDPLTNLFNRRYLDETLERELNRAQRLGLPVSAIMCDIDHFKLINDTHGHPCGDHTLRHLAALLKNSLRESDLCCRYGGEEFLLILPGSCAKDAFGRAESLRQQISSQPLSWQEHSLAICASFGVAEFPADAQTVDDLISAADQALYEAKRQGRNQVRHFIRLEDD